MASAADILFDGLNASMRRRRSSAWVSISEKRVSSTLLFRAGNASLITDEFAGHSDSVGVPRIPKILPSWSISYCPGKRGLLKKSSARIQPQDQISTGVAYVVPRRISGLLYQRVTT